MASEIPSTAPLSIGGRMFVHDVTQYRRRTLDAVRSAIDQSATGGEQSLATDGYWRRSERRWIYGSGQVVFDSADLGADSTIQRQRYLNGWNCEPDTDTLEGVRMIRRSATTISQTNCIPIGPGSSVAYGNFTYILDRTNTLNRVSTAGTTVCTGFIAGDTPHAVATDGFTVWVMCFVGGFTHVRIYSANGGTVFSALAAGSQLVPNGMFMARLFYGNGFLLLTLNTTIYSVSVTGSIGTALDTITPVSNNFVGISCITCSSSAWFFTLAIPSANDLPTGIYKISIDSTGVFGKTSSALPAPGPTEVINVAKVIGSVMLIGTTKGFRLGTLDSADNITVGPLIPVVTSDTTGSFYAGVTEFARFGPRIIASYQSAGEPFADGVASTFKAGGATNGTIIIDIGRFVDIMQPAWWFWWRKTTESSACFVCENLTNPIVAEFNHYYVLGTTNLVTPCSWITSWVTASMDYPKTFVDLVIAHDALAAGDSVAVYSQVEDAGTTWVLLGTSSTTGATSATFPIAVSSTRMRFGFVMTAASAGQATTPRMRRWQLRLIPDPVLTEEIIAALLLHEEVIVGEAASAEFHQDTLEAFNYIENLINNVAVTTVVDGSTTDQVKMDKLEMQPSEFALNTDGSYKGYQGFLIVRMLTL